MFTFVYKLLKCMFDLTSTKTYFAVKNPSDNRRYRDKPSVHYFMIENCIIIKWNIFKPSQVKIQNNVMKGLASKTFVNEQ